MNELFLTADLHIGHYAIVLHTRREQFIYPNPNYDPEKPKDFKTNWPELVNLEEHDEYMIHLWNRDVGKKDTVIIVGDFIWKNHLHYINRLNGKKILIVGNHDKVSKHYLANFTHDGLKFDMLIDDCDTDADLYADQFTDFHSDGELHKTIQKKYRLILSHCPYLSWPGSCWGSWNIHGHCHGRLREYDDILRTDIGIDPWGRLVPWEVLKMKMLKRYPKWKERFRNRKIEEQIDDHKEQVKNENINLFGDKNK